MLTTNINYLCGSLMVRLFQIGYLIKHAFILHQKNMTTHSNNTEVHVVKREVSWFTKTIPIPYPSLTISVI